MAKSKRRVSTPVYVVGEAGPTFVDLFVRSSTVKILVNQPGMQVTQLLSVTDLDQANSDVELIDGFCQLAEALHVTSYCGRTGSESVGISIKNQDIAPQLVFETGPMGMYQNELTIESINGEPLDLVIRRATLGRSRGNVVFGLMPVLQTKQSHSHDMSTHSGHVQPSLH